MGPGERYDVVVDFEGLMVGTEVFLENSAPAPYPNGIVDLTRVMKFVVGSATGDTDPIPATLRPTERLLEQDAVVTRDFELKKSGTDGCGRTIWEINGLHWDDITEYPELETVEIWRFINDSGVSHPMHMHLVFFQVLDRDTFTVGSGGEVIADGNPQAPPVGESGWKDTAMVDPGEILRVIVRFEDYKGKYAYHCHILEHEDHEMMRQFETVQCGDHEVDVTETCDDGNVRVADGCSPGCDPEEYVEFAGVASGTGGGRVELTVDGILIRIDTTAGQTAAQVAQALATAINGDPTLQSAGIEAIAAGDRVVTTGDITALNIRDNGLGELLELNAQSDRLWWGNVENVSGYDVVQGSLDSLQALNGDFTNPLVTTNCLANDTTDSSVSIEGGGPAAGSAYWYLLRRQPGGSWDGSGATRDSAVNAAANVCP